VPRCLVGLRIYLHIAHEAFDDIAHLVSSWGCMVNISSVSRDVMGREGIPKEAISLGYAFSNPNNNE